MLGEGLQPASRANPDNPTERRLVLIHRVIAPAEKSPKEYAILVTDRRSIFIRLKQARRGFVLRGEMRFGTALVTDVEPKTLEDFQDRDLESLVADSGNFMVLHDRVTSLLMTRGEPNFRLRDSFVWLTMKLQGGRFRVYDFQMKYRRSSDVETAIRFYMVPLGTYFKPKRLTQSRETILQEYAMDALQVFRSVLPAEIISSRTSSNL